MMGVKADTSEVKELAKILASAAGASPVEARKVVAKGSLNIKNDSRRRVEGLKHAPAYPRSITYDTHLTSTGAWGEIGPDKDKDKRQGALGNLIEYGSVNNPPKPHMGPAGQAEEPKFAKAMEDLAVRPLESP